MQEGTRRYGQGGFGCEAVDRATDARVSRLRRKPGDGVSAGKPIAVLNSSNESLLLKSVPALGGTLRIGPVAEIAAVGPEPAHHRIAPLRRRLPRAAAHGLGGYPAQ
jgi:hypothetical protein